jgi:hypothetical protein
MMTVSEFLTLMVDDKFQTRMLHTNAFGARDAHFFLVTKALVARTVDLPTDYAVVQVRWTGVRKVLVDVIGMTPASAESIIKHVDDAAPPPDDTIGIWGFVKCPDCSDVVPMRFDLTRQSAEDACANYEARGKDGPIRESEFDGFFDWVETIVDEIDQRAAYVFTDFLVRHALVLARARASQGNTKQAIAEEFATPKMMGQLRRGGPDGVRRATNELLAARSYAPPPSEEIRA